MEDHDPPPILRPIPRRPFALGLKSPTPPEDLSSDSDDAGSSPSSPSNARLIERFRQELYASNFLGPEYYSPPRSASPIDRPRSSQHQTLTSSTLAGIYSPTSDTETYDFKIDHAAVKRRLSVVDEHRKAKTARRKKQGGVGATVVSLASRAALLFALGLGYGVLVTRFRGRDGGDERLAFWGTGGTLLGALQPWFDKFWEDTCRSLDDDDDDDNGGGNADDSDSSDDRGRGPSTDWVLVMRAVGAFVGIAFAIRKLPWTSNMQLSATLALVNPLLWWLIDRSTPGFVLSAAVALIGSIFLVGLDSHIVPAPSVSPVRDASPAGLPGFGGLTSRSTVETTIWMLSVLFCSSLCFGNIGRRLAWGDAAVARGRWGGVR